MIKFLDLKAVTAMHADEISAAVQRVVNGGWYLQGNETRRSPRSMPVISAHAIV